MSQANPELTRALRQFLARGDVAIAHGDLDPYARLDRGEVDARRFDPDDHIENVRPVGRGGAGAIVTYAFENGWVAYVHADPDEGEASFQFSGYYSPTDSTFVVALDPPIEAADASRIHRKLLRIMCRPSPDAAFEVAYRRGVVDSYGNSILEGDDDG